MLAKLYKYARTPNRLVLMLIPLAFVWMLYLVRIQLDLQRLHVDKDYLRERIVELSKEYVKAVARDKEANTIDGQSIRKWKILFNCAILLFACSACILRGYKGIMF